MKWKGFNILFAKFSLWVGLVSFNSCTNCTLVWVCEIIEIYLQQEDVSVQLEALDILADLLSRFGGLLISFHSVLLNALLPQLASPRQVII